MSYTLTQKEYSNLKRRLTTVLNKSRKAAQTKDVKEEIAACKKVVAEVQHAERVFEEKGYPDFWNNWARAKEDAEWTIRRLDPSWWP